MVGKNIRRAIPLVSATLTIVGSVIAYQLTESLSSSQSWAIILAWMVAGIIVTYLASRLQERSQEDSPEAIKGRLGQLEPELRKQVQARSYGARRNLIEAPLRELDLDITPRVGWVRDPRLIEPEPLSERIADDIVAAFESSKRRLLIVGEPGSGKTMAAYSLIEYLDEAEGAEERIPFLVNLSAWEAQDDFKAFLVDYLCSSVGYEVHERAVAGAFISSDRYALILDGLDEIPVRLRAHFSERLDEFVRGLPGEVGVVVTCRTQEYEELLAAHSTGLGLVQAVEILPLSSEQLDSGLVELAKFDKDWGAFPSQRHPSASQRARDVLSHPLFLNLAVAGRLRPRQLLGCDKEQEVRDLVLDSYLDRTLADQRHYEPEAARRYLTWIARFLNGVEVSPFGLKTSDYTVFDLADLTPLDPPRRYRLFGGLVFGLVFGLVLALGFARVGLNFWLVWGLVYGLVFALVFALAWGLGYGLVRGLVFALGLGLVYGLVFALVFGLVSALVYGLVFGLIFVLVWGLVAGLGYGLVFALVFEVALGPFKRSAVSSRLTLVWQSTRRQPLDPLRRAGRGLVRGLVLGLVLGLFIGLFIGLGIALYIGLVWGRILGLVRALEWGLVYALGYAHYGLVLGLVLGLVYALGYGLLETRSVLITSRSPEEARSRSLIAALTWLASGLASGLIVGLVWGGLYWSAELGFALVEGLGIGLFVGLVLALNNGGWFVWLQKDAHRRLARATKLPPRPYDFLAWGIEQQIFRRVGGGVRFRHNLIQQRLVNASKGTA